MQKGDLIWLLALILVVLLLVLPTTHGLFLSMTQHHPYLTGFLKFALLATMGELLGIRIVGNTWRKPAGLWARMAVWGFIGMLITMMFEVFAGGVTHLLVKGLLPGRDSKLAFAFLTSAIMNLTFAPTFMGFHRLTDTYLDLVFGEGLLKPHLREMINRVDWGDHLSFVVLKTIPMFWIPAHTFTFLLPPEYRVLTASFLSIALGAILAMAKRRSTAASLKADR
ncbi:MAG: Mpv17/PMP22 family protein [Firmicutes bacterium]|nr:Mpv17/PMP22 family protein [Bacillota bacterium]